MTPGGHRAMYAGCTCPVAENAMGLGVDWPHRIGVKLWAISSDCPVHAKAIGLTVHQFARTSCLSRGDPSTHDEPVVAEVG